MRHGPVRSGICPSVPHVQLHPLLIRYESLTQVQYVQARAREFEEGRPVLLSRGMFRRTAALALFSRAVLPARASIVSRRATLGWGSAAALLVAHGPPQRSLLTAQAADNVAALRPSELSELRAAQPGSGDLPDPDNKFLAILEGRLPADVVDNDGDLFTFRDIRPASTLHLLVIPKRFVRDASMLAGATDADLVRRMERKATELVRAEVGAEAFDADVLALGFHWPPWYSVPWLHLHAIYPRSAMTRRYKYTPLSFISPDRVVGRIGAKDE